MLAEAGALDPADETFREYERVVDPNYLDEIRAQAKQFCTKSLSHQARLTEDTVRKFKNGKNTIGPRSLRKLTRAIHDRQNKRIRNGGENSFSREHLRWMREAYSAEFYSLPRLFPQELHRLIDRAKLGRVVGHTPEVEARRGESKRRHDFERRN